VSTAPRRLKFRGPETGARFAPVVPTRVAEGDVGVADTLGSAPGVVVLNDRIAVGPGGVTVIDAKRYRGRIAVECRGGLFRDRTEHLVVGGRDCTALVDGVLAQAEAVAHLLAGGTYVVVPVRALLCFVDGDWPWSGGLEVRGVPVVTPRRAAKLCATGDLPAAVVTAIADALRARLVAA